MKTPKPRRLPSGNYNIQLRIGGESLSITEPTAKECTRRAEYLKAQARALGNVRHDSDRITLTAAIDRYIAERSAVLSPETIRGYRIIQRNRFKSMMSRPITSAGWQAAINEESKRLSPKTVANSFLFISSVLNANDIKPPKVTLPQIVEEEHAFLQPDEIKPFLAEIEGDPAELAALLALHGLRLSELRVLTKDKLSGGLIRVSGAAVRDEHNVLVTKKENKNTTSRRTVPIMIPRLQELIDAADEITFPSAATIRRHINAACVRCGLEETGIHGLRHTFASLCFHVGIPELEAAKLGGWKDAKTMHKIYTHIAEIDKQSANAKLVAFFQ